MARKPEQPQLSKWAIYKITAKQTRVGEVEAADEREAIEKAAAEFRQRQAKLMAVRRA